MGSDIDPIAFMREHVEQMLVAAGFSVLDIVTRDLDPEHGETEWIVSPYRHYLYLSNNFGKMLLESQETAEVPIRAEIERLRKRVDDGSK